MLVLNRCLKDGVFVFDEAQFHCSKTFEISTKKQTLEYFFCAQVTLKVTPEKGSHAGAAAGREERPHGVSHQQQSREQQETAPLQVRPPASLSGLVPDVLCTPELELNLGLFWRFILIEKYFFREKKKS